MEKYGGKAKDGTLDKVIFDNGCANIEINAFTGTMYEII